MFWLSSMAIVASKESILPALKPPHAHQTNKPRHALPARFRRTRVLLVGCGDVGLRVAKVLGPGVRVMALTSQPARVPELRALGITPLVGNLDVPATLKRLQGLGQRAVHLAPPPAVGLVDPRSAALLRMWRQGVSLRALVYGSTSGVYGDCQGETATESRAANPASERARRRIDAEQSMRHLGLASGAVVSILRIPGIYAPDRAAGTPRERLLRGTPVLQACDDVYTNHIHANDLARACVAALWRGKPQRVFNVNDHSRLKMGDYFDMAADLYGLPRPPRVSRADATRLLPAMQLSFMGESRCMDNTRLTRELRLGLHHPTVLQGLGGSLKPL